MAHEWESGFTVGKAWHGLSDVVTEPLTMAEAFQRSGLDWLVQREPVYVARGGTFLPVDEYRAITRGSDLKVLSVQSEDYVEIQNIEPFRFFDELIGADLVRFHSGGSLRGGKLIWALVDAKASGLAIDGQPEDRLAPYIFARTSHDGTVAFDISRCFTRVVCANTFRIAQGEGIGSRARIFHRGDVQARIAEAQAVFAETTGIFQNYNRVINELAAKQAPASLIDDVALELFPPLTGEDSKSAIKVRHRDAKILALKASLQKELVLLPQYTQSGASYWTMFNAVTNFADHHQSVRVSERRLANAGGSREKAVNEAKFESTMIGRSDGMKQQGVALVLEAAGVKV